MSPQAFGGAWVNVLDAPGAGARDARRRSRRTALQKSLALAQFTGGALPG